MWPCGALASLLSFIYLQGWHDSPHVCMRVFQGAEGLPQLPETAKDGYLDWPCPIPVGWETPFPSGSFVPVAWL